MRGHGAHSNKTIDLNFKLLLHIAYLATNQTNVIIADWGKLAMLPCYPTAVLNTRQAGDCLGAFLLKFMPFFGKKKNFEKLHLIGFSLGAHVVSFASNIVQKESGAFFNRITGEIVFNFGKKKCKIKNCA